MRTVVVMRNRMIEKTIRVVVQNKIFHVLNVDGCGLNNVFQINK
jgi:hypothetical protein